jgi:Bacteriophage baseplate protein W
MTNDDFTGRGIRFPMGVDHTGRIATSTGGDAIAEAMITIISTAPGERAMRPAFGCTIWDELFDSINPTTLGRIELAVRQALGQWEPRAVVEQVVADPAGREEGRVDIRVTYRVRDRNDVRNLVYPFYVIPED